LVKWNGDVLLRILKQVVARREAIETLQKEERGSPLDDSRKIVFSRASADGNTVIDEVKEVIELPLFNAQAAKVQKDPSEIKLDPKVSQQLHEYITLIASMYRQEVPFHNFEHAR